MGGSLVVSEVVSSKSEDGSNSAQASQIEVTNTVVKAGDEELSASGLERRKNGLIHWRSDAADHPRNWSARRKTFDTTVIILLEFYT